MSADFTTQLALRLQDKYGPRWMLTTAANVMDEARILHEETSAAHDAVVRRTALLEAAKIATTERDDIKMTTDGDSYDRGGMYSSSAIARRIEALAVDGQEEQQ